MSEASELPTDRLLRDLLILAQVMHSPTASDADKQNARDQWHEVVTELAARIDRGRY